MARRVRVLCVWSGVGVAIWLLPASIHIVNWTADGPVRVALLPPLWQFLPALALASIAVPAISVLSAKSDFLVRLFSQTFLSDFFVRVPVSESGVGPGDALTPLALLWLWAIPYLPWIPDRAPALLLLAGPLRWGVLMLAALGSIACLSPRIRLPLDRLPGRRTVFAASLAVYVGFGLWSAEAVGPGADEPHYLVITQSLLRDHDLAIENNHARGDYHEYFGGDLRPDFLRRGLNEVIYSIHAPGLPALLVPAYAIAGYRGTVVTLCLFGALAALAIFDLAVLIAGARSAWLTWAAVCLTVPFVPHSWLIFPEMPGALIVAWAALWLYAPLPARERTWWWRGAAIGILPWLHTKFVILLAALVAALCLRLWRRPRAAVALVVPCLASGLLWIGSFYALYGVFDPQVPYGDFPRLYVLAANIPRGVLGLLFDQKFGLLMYAPVYAVAIAGCWMMLRRLDVRLFGIALTATIAAFVASSTRMYMWWGGSSAPARFLVPVLPLLAPMIAIAFHGLRSASARMMAVALLAVSLAMAAAGVVSPRRSMLFSAPHGLANMAVAAQGPSPLAYLLPTFTEDVIGPPLALLAPWAVAAAIVIVLAARVGNRVGPPTGAAIGLTVFVVAGALLAGSPSASARADIVRRGRLDLLRAYDGPALRPFDYMRGVTIQEPELFAMSAIHVSRAAGELTTDATRFAGPFDLPAGRFSARVTYRDESRDGGGRVSVQVGDRIVIADGQAHQGAPITFDLPMDAAVWLAAANETLASRVQDVELAVESIVPSHARPPIEARAIEAHAIEERSIEAIPGRPGAFIVYADHKSFPEGGMFWTQGTRASEVFLDAAGASTLALTLHVGPVEGPVRVLVDGTDHSVTLSRDETRRIEISIGPHRTLVPVIVQAAGGFRPSDHEPGSTDRRWLGCHVRVELE